MVTNPFLQFFESLATINHKVYVNHRDGLVKNGGCILSWRNITLARLYAIVDTNGDVVAVAKGGILARYFGDSMKQELMWYLDEEERKNESPRNLSWNHIDTTIEWRK